MPMKFVSSLLASKYIWNRIETAFRSCLVLRATAVLAFGDALVSWAHGRRSIRTDAPLRSARVQIVACLGWSRSISPPIAPDVSSRCAGGPHEDRSDNYGHAGKPIDISREWSGPSAQCEATCRAGVGADRAGQTYDTCMRDENDARQQLNTIWLTSSDAVRNECVGEATAGGSDSYVDLLTCLQIASWNKSTPLPPNRTERARTARTGKSFLLS